MHVPPRETRLLLNLVDLSLVLLLLLEGLSLGKGFLVPLAGRSDPVSFLCHLVAGDKTNGLLEQFVVSLSCLRHIVHVE